MLASLVARARKPGFLAAVVALAGLVACAPDLPLEGDEQIACAENADCPRGLVCSKALRCVRESDDYDPPTVSEASVLVERSPEGTEWEAVLGSRAYLKAGARLRVTFTASETLLVPPTVRLGRDGTALTLEADANPEYVFVFDPSGDSGSTTGSDVSGGADASSDPVGRAEDAGVSSGGKGGDEAAMQPEGEVGVWAELVDEHGNPATVELGTAVFDYRPPEVVPSTAAVALTPGPDNPLSIVSRVRSGTRVQLSFTLNEPLSGVPSVWTEVGGTTGQLDFAFDIADSSATTWVFSASFESADALDLCPEVLASATDLAGNQVAGLVVVAASDGTAEPQLCFDTVAPPPPGAGASLLPETCTTREALVYQRVPWGRAGGSPGFRIAGVECSMEAGQTAIAWDGSSIQSASELGRAVSDPLGALDLELSRDGERVYVEAVDSAGNRSDLALVQTVEWTASLGKKVAGSRLENPTVFTTTGLLAPTLAQDSALAAEVQGDELKGLSTSGDAALTRGGEQAWRPRSNPGAGPSARVLPASAFDAWRGRWVVFGGASPDDSRRYQDVWEYDPASGAWLDRTPSGLRPLARSGHAMAFDSRRGKAILYGGMGASLTEDELDRAVWEWDGASGLWSRNEPPTLNPGSRFGHAMTYDPVSGKVLLFGGRKDLTGNASDGSDLWSWDAATNLWTPEAAAPAGLVGRLGHAMTWDPASRRVVLHGGQDGQGVVLGDLWALDRMTSTWTRLDDSSVARAFHALVPLPDWTAGGTRVLLLGGMAQGEVGLVPSSEVWLFDGGTFAARAPRQGEPAARARFAAGRNPASGRVLIFGGGDGAGAAFADTWDLAIANDLADWALRNPRGADPSARAGHVMVSLGDGRALLAGGEAGGVKLGDSFLYRERSGTWTSAGGGALPARAGHAAAFDPTAGAGGAGAAFAFGGEGGAGVLDELWRWEEATGWTSETISGPWPKACTRAAMAFDPKEQELVLFGGWDGTAWLDATWTKKWGGDWVEHPHGAADWPEPREGASLAALDDGRVMLFGGLRKEGGTPLYPTDLWEWSGASGTWTRRSSTSGSAPERAGATLLASPARARLLLFGGEMVDPLQDPWELDPVTAEWSERSTWASPPPRARHAMAGLGSRAVLFGGSNQTLALGDTWEWDPTADGRPAAIWRVPVPAAWTVSEATLSAFAGGRGLDGATEVLGAELVRWDASRDAWRSIGWNTAPASPVQALRGTIAAADLPLSLLGSNRELVLALRPRGTNGSASQLAEVSVDYLELTVRYLVAEEQ